MRRIKIYISHSIRGRYGQDATNKQMQENCQKAVDFGKWLKEKFPNIELYIPGEHDEFVAIAYSKGWLTEKQILDIDCEIINNTCDGILMFMPDDYISTGMKREEKCNKPRCYATSYNLHYRPLLEQVIFNFIKKLEKANGTAN